MPNPVGRPTDYGPHVLEQARAYLASCGDAREEGSSKPLVKLPTVEGLSMHLGISRETENAWAAEPNKAEFSDIVNTLKAAQHEQLVRGGLSGRYNPIIAKLLLSSKHGYAEKTETDVTSKGESLSLPDARYAQILREAANNHEDQ